MSYHAIISAMIVKPENEPLLSELSTKIEIIDKGAGPFLRCLKNAGISLLKKMNARNC